MGRTTGIEFGPVSCALVAARPTRTGTDVSAMHLLEGSQMPSHDVAMTATFRAVRRSKRLPRRASVVVWGLPDDAAPGDPSSRAAVRPIVAAGFSVHAIFTPPQALARLASMRPRPAGNGAVVWMALNRQAAAIAIVHQGRLLFSRTFEWAYQRAAPNSRDELLQRYSLVSHLAPEVLRGIALVRADGISVDTAVTCGDLPDLRSLTMPLIEELDLEVETLDSTDGLHPSGRAAGDRFVDAAPALRLAVAAATAPADERTSPVPFVRVAAAVALLAALGWAGFIYWPGRAPRQPESVVSQVTPPQVTPPQVMPRRPPLTPPSTPRPAPPATAPDAAIARPEPAPATPVVTKPEPPVAVPVPTTKPAPPRVQEPALPRVQEPALPRVQEPALPPVRRVPPSPTRADLPTSSAAERTKIPAPPARVARRPAPLPDPLPRIDSILIDHSRRLAIIGGVIVRIGDGVGGRVVVEIEQDAVILREPSGLDVRVPLRAREMLSGVNQG